MPLISDLASDFTPESVSPVNSEKRLLAAILERLIMDIICDYSNPLIRERALEFITDFPFDSKNPPPFSYPWICIHLGLDPKAFLQQISEINYKPSKNRKSSYRSMIY